MRTDEENSWWGTYQMWGQCEECGRGAEGWCDHESSFFCHECWRDYDFYETLRSYRCVTFAAVYNLETGERMSTGGSVEKRCAERDALWKIEDVAVPKAIVVCRHRKNRNNTRASTGGSKPCAQCILAMQMYNVQRVCYSVGKDEYMWVDVEGLRNAYTTCNKCIVVL